MKNIISILKAIANYEQFNEGCYVNKDRAEQRTKFTESLDKYICNDVSKILDYYNSCLNYEDTNTSQEGTVALKELIKVLENEVNCSIA